MLIAILGGSQRDLLAECCILLEAAGQPWFRAPLHLPPPRASRRLYATVEHVRRAEEQGREALTRSATSVQRFGACLAAAERLLADRWHNHCHELEGGLSGLTLFEQADVEKAFLWTRLVLCRAQMLVLAALGQWCPPGTPGAAESLRAWSTAAFRSASALARW